MTELHAWNSFRSWCTSFFENGFDKSILKKWGTPRTKAVWGEEISNKMEKEWVVRELRQISSRTLIDEWWNRSKCCNNPLFFILWLSSTPETVFVRGVPHFLRMDLSNPLSKNEVHHERKLSEVRKSAIKWKKRGLLENFDRFLVVYERATPQMCATILLLSCICQSVSKSYISVSLQLFSRRCSVASHKKLYAVCYKTKKACIT